MVGGLHWDGGLHVGGVGQVLVLSLEERRPRHPEKREASPAKTEGLMLAMFCLGLNPRQNMASMCQQT